MMHQLIHGEISARLKIPSLPNLYQEMYSCHTDPELQAIVQGLEVSSP